MPSETERPDIPDLVNARWNSGDGTIAVGVRYMDEFAKIVAIHEVKKLHEELASLYRVKSRDYKRIDMLWRVIEEREDILRYEGVPGPWQH